jgi:hypothetical protein
MIVASIVAQCVSTSPVLPNTSAVHTVRVFPLRTTRALAINSSPRAGASMFILNYTVSTVAFAAVKVYAAYPQAVSAMAPDTPP